MEQRQELEKWHTRACRRLSVVGRQLLLVATEKGDGYLGGLTASVEQEVRGGKGEREGRGGEGGREEGESRRMAGRWREGKRKGGRWQREREGGEEERRRERESEGRRIARRVMGEGWGAMSTPCDTRCPSLHREGSSPSLEHSSLRMRYMCVCMQ